jgi:hypothetical protein
VGGLNWLTQYRVQVRARNAVGWGPLSDPVNVNIRPPQPVINEFGASEGVGALRITISDAGDVPLASTGAIRIFARCVSGGCNNQITEYVVDHPSPTAPNVANLEVSTANDLTGAPLLINGERYRFRVQLRNVDGEGLAANDAKGWGPRSLETVSVQVTGRPTAPTRISLQSWGLSKIMLIRVPHHPWACSTSIDRVTHYLLYRTDLSGSVRVNVNPDNCSQVQTFGWASADLNPDTLPTDHPVVQSANNFTDFQAMGFQMQACNIYGCGTPSVVWRGVTMPSPQMINGIVGNNVAKAINVGAFMTAPGTGTTPNPAHPDVNTHYRVTCYRKILGVGEYEQVHQVTTTETGIPTVTGKYERGDDARCVVQPFNQGPAVEFDPFTDAPSYATVSQITGPLFEGLNEIIYIHDAPTSPTVISRTRSNNNGTTSTWTFTIGRPADSGGPPGDMRFGYRVVCGSVVEWLTNPADPTALTQQIVINNVPNNQPSCQVYAFHYERGIDGPPVTSTLS